MTEINVFIKILLLFISIYNTISGCSSALSNQRLCYDPQCLEPVSYATVLSTYHSRDKHVMSLKISQQVMVYSKSAGNRTDIWGIKVNGKRGYFPFRFLREDKILHSNLTYLVSTSELNEEEDEKLIDTRPVTSSAQSVPSYDIVDGTTIPINDILSEASQTTSHVQPSILPHEQIEPSVMKLELNTLAKDTGGTSELETNLQSSEESSKHLESLDIDIKSVIPSEDVYTDAPISSDSAQEVPSMTYTESLDLNHKLEEGSFESIADISTTANGIDLPVTEKPQMPNDEVTIPPEAPHDPVEEKNPEEQVERRVDPYMAGLFKSSIENDIDMKQQEIPSLTDSSILDSPDDEVISESPQLSIVPNIPVEFEIPQDTILPQENIVDKEIENVTEVPEDNSSSSDIEKANQLLEDSLTEEDVNNIIDEMLSTDSPSLSSDSTMDAAVEQEKQVSNDEQSPIQSKFPDDESISIKENSSNPVSNNETTVTENIDETSSEEIVIPTSTDGPSAESEIAESVLQDKTLNFNEFPGNRNLLNVEEGLESFKEVESKEASTIQESNTDVSEKLPEAKDSIEEKVENQQTSFVEQANDVVPEKSEPEDTVIHEKDVEKEESPTIEEIGIQNLSEDTVIPDNISEQIEDSLPQKQEAEQLSVCELNSECHTETIDSIPDDVVQQEENSEEQEDSEKQENAMINALNFKRNYWESLIYVCLTAFATLAFSLGYYYIENSRRDAELVAKVNKLEKELFVSLKECSVLEENLKTTKSKLDCIEDESFGSNEMVVSLKADLQALQNANVELEEQNTMLEKELENATEAGLELERMLREVLSTNNDVNPLAQSVEDLQARLNAQQEANESLTNALNFKTQENENLSKELVSINKRNEELLAEISKLTENLKVERNLKCTVEQTFSDKIQKLEIKLKEFSTERAILRKELKNKEMEIQDLNEVINQINSNSLDLDKLYDVSRTKAEASLLLEERDELKIRLSEVEGAHQLLEEHMQNIKEEVSALSDQCKLAEKEKKDAETRLEVLSKFFKEKEMERQKEEALWLQKQGEVMSTVERIQTMQNEIQNYKQQVEMLKREIVDQEREYKTQISSLETKAHEHWVLARQNERRWEESKAEAAQLRNRLTHIEKNMNEGDADVKLHRMNANGETASPALFIGAESSSSPIMFANSSGVPPPPSYIYGSPFPPFMPPPLPSGAGVPPAPYDIGQRPPPLGGRLSSPPPVPLHPPSRYDGAGSPPLPHMLPPYDRHRSPPPRPLVVDLRDLPLPRPPHNFTSPPPPLRDDWDEERLPSPRNNPGSGFHQPHPREPQRVRNHKGSLHSSGESLDKTHHSGKV